MQLNVFCRTKSLNLPPSINYVNSLIACAAGSGGMLPTIDIKTVNVNIEYELQGGSPFIRDIGNPGSGVDWVRKPEKVVVNT